MKKLGAKGQRWLKFFHVFFAGTWIGAGICINLPNFFLNPDEGMELYGSLIILKFIDDFVIIPCAMLTLLTALIYAIFTNWGWFKYRWITIKWIITLYGIIFGTFFLGPWLNSLPPIAKDLGLASWNNPVFKSAYGFLLIFGTFQVLTLIFASYLSFFKPWVKK